MAGLSSTGLTIKTTDEVLDEINTEMRATISAGLNLSSASVLGQINGIMAAKFAELWEVARAVYSAFDPDAATDASLDRLSAVTGTVRQAATKSRVTATVNIDDGFSQAAGALVAHVNGDPARRFVSAETAANSSGVAANVSVAFEAETAGAVECLAGQLTVIAEPVTGWNSITNAADATVGLETDTDSQLRVRRRDELAGGSHTTDAIRTDLLQNESLGVIFARVLENDTDTTDANGVPRKSIEAIVYGPASPTSDDDQALAEALWAAKPAGIRAYGTTSKTVTDEQGNEHAVSFTRPTLKNVYLEIDIVVDADEYPVDGDDQVAAALVAVGDDNYQPGDDVIAERIKAAAFAVDGVLDVSALRLGFTASPVGTANLSIALREIADLDSARVVVTHV